MTRAATFAERWVGTWALPGDPAREREIGMDVAVWLRPSRSRWPVCADVEGTITIEARVSREAIAGVAEIARSGRGLALRYVLASSSTKVVLARRLDPRDPYGSLTVLIGTVRIDEADARALLRADPRAPADVRSLTASGRRGTLGS